MIRLFALVLLILTIGNGCTKNDPPVQFYFPPIGSTTWEKSTPASLSWDESKIPDLYSYLENSNTRAFIVLKDGKIVMEQYWGTQANSTAPFTATSNWYWASAGKTLTSVLVGIASDQGKINLDAKTSDYLGAGWTSLTSTQENKITVRHQLTMTTGLDDYSELNATGDKDCTEKACLIYKADAGTRWAYHNAPYTLLDGVIASATGSTLTNYFTTELRDKIGMDGVYFKSGFNNVFASTPRSMARFGLFLLNKGAWNGQQILSEEYFNLIKNTSQNINLSYGYLTWLNGKSSAMVPGVQTIFPVEITANAPDDMFAAMGRNGQLINIVPSQNLVVIRMGDAPETNLVPFTFQNEMWARLNAVIK